MAFFHHTFEYFEHANSCTGERQAFESPELAFDHFDQWQAQAQPLFDISEQAVCHLSWPRRRGRYSRLSQKERQPLDAAHFRFRGRERPIIGSACTLLTLSPFGQLLARCRHFYRLPSLPPELAIDVSPITAAGTARRCAEAADRDETSQAPPGTRHDV